MSDFCEEFRSGEGVRGAVLSEMRFSDEFDEGVEFMLREEFDVEFDGESEFESVFEF
jgi:hypothetical protein